MNNARNAGDRVRVKARIAMKKSMLIVVLGVAALAAPAMAAPPTETIVLADGQSASSAPFPMPLPAAVEKELAARAANVTEVTLGKNMLDFAAKFMDGNDKDQAAARQLIQGLDGIYVRDYEFDKDGEYSMDQIDKLRQAFLTPEWSPMVHTREAKGNESTDIMVKLVNGEPHGMFILSAEPKELSIVLILGPIRMDQLGMLKGLGGLGSLGNIDQGKQHKDKPKDKTGKGGE
jgi:Domain of unknown function (DUF4252)